MSKTTYIWEMEGASEIRKRDFDRCPNCQTHSDVIIQDQKIWKCENENCGVAYFHHDSNKA